MLTQVSRPQFKATFGRNTMKIETRLLSIALAGFSIVFASCNDKGSREASLTNSNLSSLTKKEYYEFNRSIYREHQKDPQKVGEQAKQIIIGMAGLEERPESHGVFEVDVNFNTNAMLLLVANANRIKREPEFIEEFKRQMAITRPQLKTDDELIYFDVFTILLLSEQEKLLGNRGG